MNVYYSLPFGVKGNMKYTTFTSKGKRGNISLSLFRRIGTGHLKNTRNIILKSTCQSQICRILHHILCILHHTLCILHHILCILHHTLSILHHILCILHHILCILHHILCILHHALCILHHILCILHHILCILHHILHHILCILHQILCILHHILCILKRTDEKTSGYKEIRGILNHEKWCTRVQRHIQYLIHLGLLSHIVTNHSTYTCKGQPPLYI